MSTTPPETPFSMSLPTLEPSSGEAPPLMTSTDRTSRSRSFSCELFHGAAQTTRNKRLAAAATRPTRVSLRRLKGVTRASPCASSSASQPLRSISMRWSSSAGASSWVAPGIDSATRASSSGGACCIESARRESVARSSRCPACRVLTTRPSSALGAETGGRAPRVSEMRPKRSAMSRSFGSVLRRSSHSGPRLRPDPAASARAS